MTYDNSRLDDGFRDSPAFRDSFAYREAVAAQGGSTYREEETTTRNPSFTPGTYTVGGRSSADYDYGTDSTMGLADQDQQDDSGILVPLPPRDRLSIHFGWEFVLLLAVGGVAFLLYRVEAGALRGARLDALYLHAASIGFAAVGMALSLRAAVPNLAVGALAYAVAMFFADNSDRGLLVTAGVAALLAVAVGVAMALVVTVLHVPAWAASLGAAFGLIVWIQQHRGPVRVVNGAYDPTDHAVIWFAGFVVVSLAGGLLGLSPRVRETVGRYRLSADPATRAAGSGSASLGLIGSSVLAAVSGVLLALVNREVTPTENGLALTGLALGAALFGGTSVFGRRGGVLGTVLAVSLMTLLVAYANGEGWVVQNFGLAAVALGLGLLASRFLESMGRGREPRVTRISPARDSGIGVGSGGLGGSGGGLGGGSGGFGGGGGSGGFGDRSTAPLGSDNGWATSPNNTTWGSPPASGTDERWNDRWGR